MASQVNVDRIVNFESRGYLSTFLTEESIAEFRFEKKLSSTGKEEDLIVECCKMGEPVCLARPRGVQNESAFYVV